MAQRKIILIVDDDDDLRASLGEQLEVGGEFSIFEAASAEDGIGAALLHRPDLILMDLDLPGKSGREACRHLRGEGVSAPIIMLTASDSDSDTILGLESGANDYVTKPFKMSVLMARIRAQLRDHEQSEDAVFHIGPYEFRPATKVLIDDKGKKLRLTDKETNILKYLYRAGEKPVSREELLAEVWGYNAGVTTHTLETHIYRLRQKVERDASTPSILVTEGGGYKLIP